MSSVATSVLDVRRLSVSYLSERGAVEAVKDVSFAISRGEVFGLAGESGSGKSTVAMALLRLLRPPAVITGGEVVITGKDVMKLNERELRDLRWREAAIVFQSALNVLNPILTIGDQFVDVIRAHMPVSERNARERAGELLRTVGMSTKRLESYPHQLSGGMRQRVVLAIALALGPELLILDEPTTALDVVVQRDIMEELKELQADRGFASLFITHDLPLLAEFATRIAIMYAGEIVEVASATDIFESPHHPYTQGLRDSSPARAGGAVLRGIPGTPPDMLAPPAGCRFHPRCPFVMRRCRHESPRLKGIELSDRRVACHLHDS